jgi:hypothetical protein
VTTLITTPVVGLEDIQRAAFYAFFENFNTVLAEVEASWIDKDQIFNQRTGRNIAPITLEQIPSDNFHEGHKPSLIQNGPDGYPNLAVFAMRADPSAETDSFDQIDSWSDSLLVEIMVKAEADEENPGLGEEIVNRRIQRTTEAAMICLRHNPTLGGAVTGLENTPTVIVSDVFAMKATPSEGGYGKRYIWQGSAIQARIRKDSVSPPPIGGIFSGASQTNYSQFIDQG